MPNTKQKKLQELRDAWVKETDPIKKKIIENRAKLLKWSMHPADILIEKNDKKLEKTVKKVLC